MDLEAEIYRRIDAAIESDRMPEGLLFHGTVETIDGPLRPGVDKVFWTSDNPRIAQQYMPASGSSALFAAIPAYEREHHIRPSVNSPWFEFAKTVTGFSDGIFDVETDVRGRLQSWRIPKGWLTYEQAAKVLEEKLGYEAGKDHWVKTSFSGDGQIKYHHADYLMPGRLLVTLSDGLRLQDLRRSTEGNLMDADHHLWALFEAANAFRHDGVIINDFAQTDRLGNLGHVSYGILPNHLPRLEWVTIPATRHVLHTQDDLYTMPQELLAWRDQNEARFVESFRV